MSGCLSCSPLSPPLSSADLNTEREQVVARMQARPLQGSALRKEPSTSC